MQSKCERADLQIEEVAAFCNVSSAYLRKIVKEVYQKTPFHLLTDLRMKKACELLLEKRPIKEIASSVGYSDIYQFSRAYKRYFGYPPSTIDNNNPPAMRVDYYLKIQCYFDTKRYSTKRCNFK